MMKVICFSTVALMAAALPLGTAVAGDSTDYKLVWADEFNRDGRPDPNNWIYERGFVRNEELQWYQPEQRFL